MDNTDYVRAHSRLAIASDTWMRAQEAFELAKVEYFAAIKEVEDLTPPNE